MTRPLLPPSLFFNSLAPIEAPLHLPLPFIVVPPTPVLEFQTLHIFGLDKGEGMKDSTMRHQININELTFIALLAISTQLYPVHTLLQLLQPLLWQSLLP